MTRGILAPLAMALCCASAAAFLPPARLPTPLGHRSGAVSAPRLRVSLATSLRASTASPTKGATRSQYADGDVPVEHRGIPTEHKELHITLYGDGDDHGATEDLKLVEFDGTQTLPVIDFLKMADGAKESAVFALYGDDGKCNYIDYTHDVVSALTAECRSHGDEAAKVRVLTVKSLKRSVLEELKKKWLGELDYVPVGNEEATSWGRKVVGVSPEQHALHEESKFKLTKPMADTALIVEMPQLPEEEKIRRANLQMAVEGDDWSGEIDKQTTETIQTEASDVTISSPFEGGANVGESGEETAPLPFTKEAIDGVLDEVRPYLIADGGNCRVVSVDKETGDVQLQLEGACGTCPSATVTMKQGIERVLRENFGSRLGEVTQVQPSVVEQLSVEMVEQVLAPVRPAVEGLGGSVKVLDLDTVTGEVVLAYSGPDKLTYGIELTLMDNPLIKTVKFEAP
mmetsp:Transcript_47584/g.115872  ORF Transcript_47584/g.115872 Transcript_47584/m.115872 type:complete len:457 (-) Transcript_47584:772-2142(-)